MPAHCRPLYFLVRSNMARGLWKCYRLHRVMMWVMRGPPTLTIYDWQVTNYYGREKVTTEYHSGTLPSSYCTQKIWESKTCQKFVILTGFGSSFRWCPKRRVYVCQDKCLWQNLLKGRQAEQSNICQFQIIFISFPQKTPKRTQQKLLTQKFNTGSCSGKLEIYAHS